MNNREEIGHMEWTLCRIKRKFSMFLVLTDRKSRLQIIRKMNAKTMENVVHMSAEQMRIVID